MLICQFEPCNEPIGRHGARGFCARHYKQTMRGTPLSLLQPRKSEAERFFDHVQPEPNSGCWLWTAAVDHGGYGLFRTSARKMARAPKYSYEMHVGPVPDGLQLDHLCRTRSCVNPDHLEPVTPKENTRRSPIHCGSKTHCPQGHPYSGSNLYVNPDGKRLCRQCRSDQHQKRKAMIAAAKGEA